MDEKFIHEIICTNVFFYLVFQAVGAKADMVVGEFKLQLTDHAYSRIPRPIH